MDGRGRWMGLLGADMEAGVGWLLGRYGSDVYCLAAAPNIGLHGKERKIQPFRGKKGRAGFSRRFRRNG